MSSVDKIKVNGSTYDISPSSNGTLNGFTSSDSESSGSWSDTDIVSSSDTNSTIFSKITTMIKNVRWLYSKLGTTDFSATGQSTVTGALSALQTGLGNKAAKNHSHITDTLPISGQYINSNDYVPTSALIYSMQSDIDALSEKIANLQIQLDPPNERYESTDLGTWSSASDVDTFLSRFNHDNNYKDGNTKLSLGNYVTIQDGTYNAVWMIAGFDMESNQLAADGTIYDNGYGICMIPQMRVSMNGWSSDSIINGAYMSSTMNTSHLPNIVTKLQTILGSHIINRNVLLSSSIDSSDPHHSNAYTWTTVHSTLMSIGQMTGMFAENNNKYDDGEANYKLPVFNYQDFKINFPFWSRNFYGREPSNYDPKWYKAWFVESDISHSDVENSLAVRPLIYLR